MTEKCLDCPEDKVYFTGWLRIHYTRELDVDKNPKTEWELKYLGKPGCNSGLANPYLYTTKGRAGYPACETYPIYETNPYEFPKYDLQRENPDKYEEMKSAWVKFNASKKIVGYHETKIEIKEVKVTDV